MTAPRFRSLKFLPFAAVFAAALMFAPRAQAASITITNGFSIDYTVSKSGNGSNSASFSGSLDFGYFDATLGTLTGVTVNLNSSADLTTTANGSGFLINDTATGTANLSASMGTGSVPSLGMGGGSVGASCSVFLGSCHDSNTLTINLVNTIGPGASAFVGNPAQVWTVLLFADASIVNRLSGVSGSGLGTAAGNWSGQVTTTYTYTPAPEPGSMLLLGTGLLLVSAQVRRRMLKGRK